jgi:short subunit dehydrogenase-like uncharacterized protein
MTDRPYDVVLFGATGFTGRLTADYLAKAAPPGFRWAIAGRDAKKLAAVKEALLAAFPAAKDFAILTASAEDPAALLAVAKSTRVVATTVGPYALHGEPLVKACIEAGAHYADITGEPGFVSRLVATYDDAAKQAGVAIVNCCGFDSIPADMGVFFTMKQLDAHGPAQVRGIVRIKGAFSGGTWASAVNAFGNARSELRMRRASMQPPKAQSGRRHRPLPARVRYDRSLGAWICPLPTIDPQVVLRSAKALESYGPDFRYGHYFSIKSSVKLVTGALGLAAVVALAQAKPTRQWLTSLKKSGDGPSKEERAKNWFKLRFEGESNGRSVVTQVSGGDAGYEETSKMLGESALALAFDRERAGQRAGVLTPAAALGDVLLERLQKAGLRFEVLPS